MPSSRPPATTRSCTGRRAGTASRCCRASRRSPTQVGLPGQEAAGARLLTAARRRASRFTTRLLPERQARRTRRLPGASWPGSSRSRRICEATATRGRAAVVCGDFNIVPGRDRLVRRGGAARLDLPHRRGARALRAPARCSGFVDVFRALHPDTQAFSWWDYRGGAFHRKHGPAHRPPARDASRSSLACARVEIDREFRKKQNDLTPSDHAPVIADLRLKATIGDVPARVALGARSGKSAKATEQERPQSNAHFLLQFLPARR